MTPDDRVLQVLERLDATCRDLTKAVALLGQREACVSSVTKHTRLLPAREVAALFACDQRTLRRWTRAGEVPKPITIGGVKRWRLGDIEKWLEKRR